MQQITPTCRNFYIALEALWLEQTGDPLPIRTDLALVLDSVKIEKVEEVPHLQNPFMYPPLLVTSVKFYQKEEPAIDSQEASSARNSIDPTSASSEGLQHDGDVHAARPPVQEHRVRQILPGTEET